MSFSAVTAEFPWDQRLRRIYFVNSWDETRSCFPGCWNPADSRNGISSAAIPLFLHLEKQRDAWSQNPVHLHRWHRRLSGRALHGWEWIINFREGSFQGYGSNWWSPSTEGQDKPGGGTIVLFKNGVPFRSSTAGYQKGAPTKLLTVGLGSTLYYGNQRGNFALLRAAEGVWNPQKGCRHINGRY